MKIFSRYCREYERPDVLVKPSDVPRIPYVMSQLMEAFRVATTMNPQRSYIIAVLPGDGIGLEVTPPALRCLEAAALRFRFRLEFREYPWASCTYYLQHGTMVPQNWKSLLRECDAIYFGAGE